jgi:hypothetical protein
MQLLALDSLMRHERGAVGEDMRADLRHNMKKRKDMPLLPFKKT